MEPRGLSSIPLPYEVDEAPHQHQHQHYLQPHFPMFAGGPQLPSFLHNLKQDDIILICLIVLLLTEGNNCDFLLVGVLVFVFFAGLEGNPFGILGL